VGGDFYDAFAVGENRWGIAIGDVCGKGARAAALTARARYTIRALADRAAGSVLGLLNEAVMRDRDMASEQLLSAVFAVASVSEDGGLELRMAAAGHPFPLVLRADGTVEPVRVSGLLIGVSAGVRYGSRRLVLAPGDVLMLYTDGLTDAQAPRRILSGRELGALLASGHGMAAEPLVEFIERGATGGEESRDDIALLVVQLEGRAVLGGGSAYAGNISRPAEARACPRPSCRRSGARRRRRRWPAPKTASG
jgi:serine phosphatase RsbU (regulator of sigma subunit)